MFSFPYGRQVLFHITFSLCASIFLGYAVFDCNFVEISQGWQNVNGASIGFWQAEDEINGNVHSPGRFRCVAWTAEQTGTFDAAWNYGRYGGPVIFAVSCSVTLMLCMTTCTFLHPKTERRLAVLQFVLAFFSALMLVAMESNICDEFDCWLDIGGVVTIAASIIQVAGGWIALSLRNEPDVSKSSSDSADLDAA